MRSFQQLDLNLLRVFKVLYEELHTGRTAERLHVAQPSISRSLKRLRDHCEDPLFLKTKDGLTPTPLASQMAAIIPDALEQLASSFNQFGSFDISQRSEPLRIAVNPFLALSLPAKLHLHLEQIAPNILLEVENWDETTPSKLSNGDIDLAINYYPMTLPKEIISQPIITDTFQILARVNHPLQKQPNISYIDTIHYPFATVIVKGWNDRVTVISKVFAQHNLTPKMGYRSQVFSSVAQVAAESDTLLPCSSLISPNVFPHLAPIQLIDESPLVHEDVHLYYHHRRRNDPLIECVFSMIKQIADDLDSKSRT